MRSRKGSTVKPQTVILSIVVCAAICLAGIGYLWGKTEVWQLSREIKKLELRRDELKRSNNVMQREYAVMCAPARLDARVRELNLGLSAPLPDQILRLKEPAPNSPPKDATIYAANTND